MCVLGRAEGEGECQGRWGFRLQPGQAHLQTSVGVCEPMLKRSRYVGRNHHRCDAPCLSWKACMHRMSRFGRAGRARLHRAGRRSGEMTTTSLPTSGVHTAVGWRVPAPVSLARSRRTWRRRRGRRGMSAANVSSTRPCCGGADRGHGCSCHVMSGHFMSRRWRKMAHAPRRISPSEQQRSGAGDAIPKANTHRPLSSNARPSS